MRAFILFIRAWLLNFVMVTDFVSHTVSLVAYRSDAMDAMARYWPTIEKSDLFSNKIM